MDVLTIASDGIGMRWGTSMTQAYKSGGLRECVTLQRGVASLGRHDASAWLVAVDAHKPFLHLFARGKDTPVYKCALQEKVLAVAASRDGRMIAAGSGTGMLYLWMTHSGELVRVMNGHYRAVCALAFSPCSSALVTGGQDGLVHAWDTAALIDVHAAADAAPVASFSEHTLAVTCVTFGPGFGVASRLISSSVDCTVRVWDVPAKRAVCAVNFPSPVHVCTMDALEHRLYAGCADGVVYTVSFHAATATYDSRPAEPTLFSLLAGSHASVAATGKPSASQAFLGHTAGISDLCLTADDARLVTGSLDGTARVWDTASFQCVHTFREHHAPIHRVLLLPRQAPPLTGATSASETAEAPVDAAIVVAPLKKHATVMPLEWRASMTGPLSKDDIVCMPSLPGAFTESESARAALAAATTALVQAARAELEAAANGGGAPVATSAAEATPALSADEAAALQERVAQLEAEVARWQVVNNKLMQRLQGVDAPRPDAGSAAAASAVSRPSTAAPARAGTKRGAGAR